jgi:beta-lactamase superfamily II metal-dependent hydrolase
MKNILNRRRFLSGIAAAALAPLSLRAAAKVAPWKPGQLDIHHISLGRGVCAFLLCPDGTTVMIDAGDAEDRPEVHKYLIDPKPNGSRRPGEWIARYIGRHMEAAGLAPAIDYVLLTHLHSDHMGRYDDSLPKSKYGNYRTSGIMEVAETIAVKKVIDRAYPNYDYPAPLNDAHQKNYRSFIASLPSRGASAERFQVGSRTQIRLRDRPDDYPDFGVRNIAANGEVWTGVGESTRQLFPKLSQLRVDQYPTENMCSLAIRLSYGRFDYYTAGDMSCDTNNGRDPWRDIETPAAKTAGPVEVAVADHHGYVDATGPDFVRALQPQAFVVNAWDSAHPTMGALHNMLSRGLYPGDRAIFATGVKPESLIAIRRLAELASSDGHVVFRVSPGGGDFRVNIVSSRTEADEIVAEFGPFACR